jgi:hypothetical protein
MTIFEWASRYGVGGTALNELLTLIEGQDCAGPRLPTAFKTEEAVQSALQIEAPRRGCSLWRNNSGALKDETGRLIRYGLGHTSAKTNEHWKSSDLIGIFPRMITPDMVGSIFGQFAAVEVKTPGWKKPSNDRERAQARFLGNVTALGGFATFAQSEKDVFQ